MGQLPLQVFVLELEAAINVMDALIFCSSYS